MKRLPMILVISVALALWGCNLVTGPDLKAKAEQDVKVARALNKVLTITAVDKGTTSPSGAVDIKDGIALEIDSSAQPEAVLVGWKQTGGDGKATFEPVEGSLTKIQVTVAGGDATIEPVYEVRPVLLYMTPIGNNIAKNSSVRLVFNREVELGTGSSSLVTIKKQGVTEVPYVLSTKAGSTTVTLKPTAVSLDDYAQYVVTVQAGIPLKASFDPDHYPGVTFINTTVVSRSEEISPFQTGANFDTLPPYNGSFEILSSTGSSVYSPNDTVTLTHIQALDDSGDGGVASFAVRNGADPFPDFPEEYEDDGNLKWNLPSSADGSYTVGMIFRDVNGNAVPETSSIDRVIFVDATAPIVDGFNLTTSANAPGYVNGLTVPFALSSHDPQITGSSALGSGESTDGTNPSEQKQFRTSMDNVTWTSWAGFQESGSVNLPDTADGTLSAYVQVKDGMGNVSNTRTTSLILDRSGPTIGALLPDGTLITNNLSVTLNLAVSDLGSGVDKINFGAASTGISTAVSAIPTVAGTAQTPIAFTSPSAPTLLGGPISVPDSLSFSLVNSEGSKHIDLVATDRLGNVTTKGVDIFLDQVAPTSGTATFAAGAATASTTAVINLTASDSGSGLFQVGWVTDETSTPVGNSAATWQAYQSSITVNLNPTASGIPQYAHLWYKDVAGNVTTEQITLPITYTTTNPTASISLGGAKYDKDGVVTVTWSATGASNNITDVWFSNNGVFSATPNYTPNLPSPSGSLTWNLVTDTGGSSTNGKRSVFMKVKDQAGLETTKSVTIVFDNVLPTVSGLTLTGTGGAVATNSSTINVAFTVADNVTGATSLVYDISDDGFSTKVTSTASASSISTSFKFSTGTNQTKTVSVRVTDLAANTSVTSSATIIYDTTTPVVTGLNLDDVSSFFDRYANTADGIVNIGSIGYTDNALANQTQMRVSNDGVTWSAWVAYAGSISAWNLTSGYGGTTATGTKTLRLQVKDAAGNISASGTDTIIFDNLAPTAATPWASTPTALATAITISADRVVVVNNVGVNDTGSSGIWQMKYWSGSVGSGWQTYAASFKAALPPINGSKNINVAYRDKAGNVSATVTIPITLNAAYANLRGRQYLVGANYDDPNNLGTIENNSWMVTVSPLALGSAAAPVGPRSFAFVTASGQVGWLDFYLGSANQIRPYFSTYNSSNVVVQGSPNYWADPGANITVAAGSYISIDLDSSLWNATTNAIGAAHDIRIYNSAGTFYLYVLGTTKFALF